MSDLFIQACAKGDGDALRALLAGMTPNDAGVVVDGIEQMRENLAVREELAVWGKQRPRCGLMTLSTAFLRGNMTVAGFVLEHMMEFHHVQASFNFLFVSGKHLPSAQREAIARLVAEKCPPSVRASFLEAAIDGADGRLVEVVYSTLPDTTVKANAPAHQIDLWPHVLRCANAVSLERWSNEGKKRLKKHIAVFQQLLTYVDSSDLQQRLTLEQVANPHLNVSALEELIQQRQRMMLEKVTRGDRRNTVRKI